MKKLLSVLVIAAFAMSASAHCGKCEGDNDKEGHKAKAEHKCTEACKGKCQADHKCTDACKDKCAAAKKDGDKK